ncbi:MAG: type IV secretion system DNA-binding domain-containing protein [Christensenellaceae bacterium]|jgi:hypothetical protein|nr:type IV secretion system DNA-binding domain-containing protein [Christensenellaceae bacterium]
MSISKSNNPERKKRHSLVQIAIVPLIIIFTGYLGYLALRSSSGAVMPDQVNATVFLVSVPLLLATVLSLALRLSGSKVKKTAIGVKSNVASFASSREIDSSRLFVRADANVLTQMNDGVPINVSCTGKKFSALILQKAGHICLLGNRSSQRAISFYDSTIQILPRYKTKPHLFITDPCGELYKKHSEFLRTSGYSVVAIDYDNPFGSTRINPLQPVLDKIALLQEITKQHSGKYSVAGKVFETYPDAALAEETCRQETLDSISSLLKEITSVLFDATPLTSNTTSAAKDLIIYIIYSLFNDVLRGHISKEKFCLHNIYRILCDTDSRELQNYFDQQNTATDKSVVLPLLPPSEDVSLSTLLSEARYLIGRMSEIGIRYITADSDFNLSMLKHLPCAVFISYSENSDSSKRLVSCLLRQIQLTLEEWYCGATLVDKRRSYFLLTDFCDLVAIPGLLNTLEADGDNVSFVCGIETVDRLTSKYGKQVAYSIMHALKTHLFTDLIDSKTFESLTGDASDSSTTDSVNLLEQKFVDPRILTESKLDALLATCNNTSFVADIDRRAVKASFTPVSENSRFYSVCEPHPTEANSATFDLALHECKLTPHNYFSQPKTRLCDRVTNTTHNGCAYISIEDARKQRITKLDEKLARMSANKTVTLLHIKSFLSNKSYTTLTSASAHATPGIITDILKEHADLPLQVRLDLVSVSVLSNRIAEIERERTLITNCIKEQNHE